MKIVLDTNIIFRDFFMKSGRFEILLDYVKRTNSKVILPRIVYDEVLISYERELKSRHEQYIKIKNSLSGIIQGTLAETNVSPEEEVVSYEKYLKKKLRIKDEDIFDYKETYLHDVMDRAMRRKRPCTERGEEIRDAVLWLSILDIAEKDHDRSVIFISNNKKQFALDNDSLHPSLLTECGERDLKVIYFSSLDNFAIEHASHIDFITEEWLLKALDLDKVLESSNIEYYLKRKLSSILPEDEIPTGHITLIQCPLAINYFYVYEMTDGSIKVEMEVGGEAEIECELEDHLPVEGYIPEGFRGHIQYKYECFYPIVELTLDITIKDKEVKDWNVIDQEVY